MEWERSVRYFSNMRSLVLALALLTTSAVTAADFSNFDLFIPVVSRVPGAFGTNWRTDLVVANRSDAQTSVRLIYEANGSNTKRQGTFFIPARGSITIPDFILEVYELTQTYGTLRITALNENVKLAAHARIYNVGTAEGEFGQVILALPLNEISKRAWINGVIGIRDNRTNVGIANPNDGVAHFSITSYDKNGVLLNTKTGLTVEPWDVLLLNDIFAFVNTPLDEGMTLRIDSDVKIYAYGSVVRNDTGDAYTVMGDGSDN
jgi:hypothetical protein